jgi:hypothetical protein
MDLPMPPRAPSRPASPRRLIAAGIIRRHRGRTTRLTVTPAGVTGSIRTTAVTR